MFPAGGLGFTLYQENKGPRGKPPSSLLSPEVLPQKEDVRIKSVYRKVLQLGEDTSVFPSKPLELKSAWFDRKNALGTALFSDPSRGL